VSETYPKAKAAALRALEIDSTLAEPHATLAWVAFGYDLDHQSAEREFKRALELNPNYATAHQWYALYLAVRSRMEEAFKEIRRAQELDPLSLIINTAAGWIYHFARRYDDAIRECQKATDMDPNFFGAHMVLADTYDRKQMFEEAVREYQAAFHAWGETKIADAIGRAYSASGYKAAMHIIIDRISKGSTAVRSRFFAARIAAAIGDKERAMALLEKAYEEKDEEVAFAAVIAMFDNMRSDPRFQELMRRLHIPD
jgi:tetratricopeptide (TPR) repeat protein